MLRTIFAATLTALILFCFIGVQPAQSQLIFKISLSAASQDNLPVRTDTYQAGGHLFTWTFSWTNVTHNPGDAEIFPRVVGSDMTADISNGDYGNGPREVGNNNNTGYPSDYLQITEAGGSVHGRFTNMLFKVVYYNTTPTGPVNP
jgi:hypothetical protein